MNYSIFCVVTRCKVVWYRRFGIIDPILKGRALQEEAVRYWKIGLIGTSETSVSTHLTLRNSTEDHGGSVRYVCTATLTFSDLAYGERCMEGVRFEVLVVTAEYCLTDATPSRVRTFPITVLPRRCRQYLRFRRLFSFHQTRRCHIPEDVFCTDCRG